MFFNQRPYHGHGHGTLFVLSLVGAFLLGRKSERYGLSIVSRGCCCSDELEDDDMMSDPNLNYPE